MNNSPIPYRIVLADDHGLIRHGIKNIIQKDSRFAVVAEVENCQELFQELERTETDLVVLDVSMPGMSGIEAVGRIRKQFPSLKILMLTMHKSRQVFREVMAAGADGYLMKGDPDSELLVALEKLLAGKNYVSPNLVDDVADDMIGLYRGDRKTPFQELTKREKEVLQLVVKGFTSRKMAAHLNLSQRTIDHHRANLLRKLDKKNSVDLVNYAVRNGFVSLE